MGKSRLEPARDQGYKCSSMLCPTHRNLLARSLAFALIVATQLSSVSIAAELLFAPPAPEGTDSTELPTRLPPVDEFDASFDGTDELPLELQLESDQEAAKPRRGGRGGMGRPMGGGGLPIGYRAIG